MMWFKRLLLAALLLAPAQSFAQGTQFPTGTIWGNDTAAQRPGKVSTVTSILDRALGSTRGAILERGVSGWAVVGPGTTGKAYVSNGSGADPAYQTLGIAGGGTNCVAASGACLDNITGFAANGYIKRTGAGTYSQITTVPVADGGTGGGTASGTLLDNITGFGSTGYIKRTGAGTYAFGATVPYADLPVGTQDTVLGYFGSTTASAATMPNCTGALQYSTSTHTFACGAGGGGVTTFNSRAGAVVPVAGDYTVALGGTGTTNCTGQIAGLQPLKLGGASIAVNPGTWCNNIGTAAFNSTTVMNADLTQSVPSFASSPAVGAQVSGALNVVGATTDGTEVFLYLIHRNSDGKTALVGSSADTQGPNNNTFTSPIASPGVMTFGSVHGLRKRMAITVSNSGGALPTGLAAATQYYVCTAPSTTTITLATSIANVNAGTCINFTTAGTGTNTATWGVQAELNFQLGAGVATFDRRLPYFAFVWSWTKYGNAGIPGGTNGIPDFQTSQGSSDTLLTAGGTGTPFQALGGGTSASFATVDLSPWLANLNRRVTIITACRYPASIGSCFIRTPSSGSGGTQVGQPTSATVDSGGMFTFQTDSTMKIEYFVTGGAALSIYILGWSFVDPS